MHEYSPWLSPPGLSTKGAGQKCPFPVFPCKEFNKIPYQLLLQGLASNQPAVRCLMQSSFWDTDKSWYTFNCWETLRTKMAVWTVIKIWEETRSSCWVISEFCLSHNSEDVKTRRCDCFIQCAKPIQSVKENEGTETYSKQKNKI